VRSSKASLVLDPPWKKLVLELKDVGYESPYLDRLRARLDVAQTQESLEKEIVQEMAQALGRTEEKLNLALLRLELAARHADEAPNDAQRTLRAKQFNDLRSNALRARHELLIHREAIGIRRNQILETLYPIPPRRPL
jgi:uncharacterized protein YdiU (UPF0061 family)